MNEQMNGFVCTGSQRRRKGVDMW